MNKVDSILEFEWDADKEILNRIKHRVPFITAVETFFDPNGFQLMDKQHSTPSERRTYWIGKSLDGKILTTWFTERNGKVRIIGCAEWRKFRRLYHEITQPQ